MTEKFHWTSPKGATITLPHLKHVKAGVLRKYRKLPELDMVFSIIEDISDADTLALIDNLDQGDLEGFMVAWQKGVSVGESSGSST